MEEKYRKSIAPEERKDYDTLEKELEEYPDVFADIINALIYQGTDTVKPENLQSAAVETRYRDLDGRLRHQTEDLAKYEVVNGETKILFLLANQSTVDSRMVLRKCGYTGGCYRSQYIGQANTICPVMELVLYWGEKRWRTSGSIHRFFKKKCLPERAWRFIDNERIHVFEMRHLPRKMVKQFKGDMRIVLEFLSDDPDESCFAQKIEHAWAVREFLITLLGNDRYRALEKGFMEKKASEELCRAEKGECTVRDWIGEAWDRGVEEGIEQGIEQGKAQGIEQGRLEGISLGIAKGIEILVSSYREFGMTFEETAAKLKEKFDLADAEVEKDMKLYW